RARRLGRLQVDLGEALVRLDVLAPPDDAIGERDVRSPALQFAHLEAGAAPAPDIEAAAVAFGGEEHVIAGGFDHFRKIAIELHRRASVLKLRHAEVLQPTLLALHAINPPPPP